MIGGGYAADLWRLRRQSVLTCIPMSLTARPLRGCSLQSKRAGPLYNTPLRAQVDIPFKLVQSRHVQVVQLGTMVRHFRAGLQLLGFLFKGGSLLKQYSSIPPCMHGKLRVLSIAYFSSTSLWLKQDPDNIPTVKMAEALGLTSSIVALVQLSASIYSATSKFYREAKEAKSNIGALATQTRNLSGVLQNLSLLASSPLFDDAGLSFPDFKDTHIESCRNTLYKVKRKLEKAENDFESGSQKRVITRTLKWPFASQETNDLITELSRHQDVLHVALSAQTMSNLLQCLANTNSIAKSVHTLNQKLDRKETIDMRAELTAKREEIVRFFLKINPENQLQDCRSRRQPNTGKWLIERDQTFRNWMALAGSQIWLSGIPGKNPHTF